MLDSSIDAGIEITCTNPDCDCSFMVNRPCPHGDEYRCGCGAPLLPADSIPEKLGTIKSD